MVWKLIQAGASVEDDLHNTTCKKLESMLIAAIEISNKIVVEKVLEAYENINRLEKMKNYLFNTGKYYTSLIMIIKK